MSSTITITINLPGRLGGRVAHTTKQVATCKISDDNGKPTTLTRKILHTDRPILNASRQLIISPEVLREWTSNNCPDFFNNQKQWKKMTITERIKAHVSQFDEGWGVSYE